MKLIDNAKHWYKMFSIQAQIAAGAVLGAWQVIPDDLKNTLPHNTVYIASMSLLVLGIIGRLVKQDSIPKE